MRALVVIMVDALRHDYVGPDTTPFLHSLATAGSLRSLIPPFGFEPDYTIFAGLEPFRAHVLREGDGAMARRSR